MLCLMDSDKPVKQRPLTACRCSKGFRSVSGHGHFHCRRCRKPFRYRSQMLKHEQHGHGKTEPDSAEKTEHESAVRILREKTAARSSSVEIFPPYRSRSLRDRKIKQSDSGDSNSDSQKYGTQVTICADGKEQISRVPCYAGNVVFPSSISRHQKPKTRCPICSTVFVRIETLRNHVICVHDIIRPGDTVYYCVPCTFKTSYGYSFTGHKDSYLHRSVLEKSKSETCISSARQVSCFYSNMPSRLGLVKFGGVEKQARRVVWHGHSNHVCSSHCLSGLSIQLPSAGETTSLTPDAPADTLPTATTSVDNVDEFKTPRSCSETCVKKKATARKSTTTQPLTVAFNFMDKNKETAVRQKVHDVSESAETSPPRSVNNKAALSDKAITIIDSDSDTEEVASVKSSPVVTRSSNSGKKRASSGVTKPSTSTTVKQKDSLSVNSDSHAEVQTPKSTCAPASRVTVSHLARSSGSSVVSISEQNSSKCTTSTAIKGPLCVTTTQQVSESHSSSTTVSVHNTVSAVTSSGTSRSAPVIGVAKAVPTLTAVTTQATTTLNRSIYSLHRFSAETLWSELSRRGSLRTCDCGVSFMDSTLYLLHRSCHSDLAPLKCAFCDHKAATSYDFHAHLLDHKK